MPNAMVNGIAQANVNQNVGPNGQQNAPWVQLSYQGASNKFINGGQAPANGTYDNNGNFYLTNGQQGAGWYRGPTDEQYMRDAQQYYTKQFRDNIPQTESTLYNQMASGVNQSMNQGIKNVQQNNSRRGLLFGGINAGQEGAVRASAASQLAEGRSAINSSVESAANSMDQMSIDTGVAIQQQQQQMQNAIYSNAMAQMNAQNGLLGGALGAAGMAAGMAFGGPVGGLIGAQAGKALA